MTVLFLVSFASAAPMTCTQCDQLFGNESANRYRLTLDQSTLNACTDVDGKADYRICQKTTDEEKRQCGMDCLIYLEGPCYEECQQNYQGCLANCVTGYNDSSNTCVNILLDGCYSSCVNECTNPCAEESLALKNAQVEAEIACQDVLAPGRLLAPDATIASCDPDPTLVLLCAGQERGLNDAEATLLRAETALAELTQEKNDLKFIHPNESQSLADLEREYESFDLDAMKEAFETADLDLANYKHEMNIAWWQAIMGGAGPLGILSDGLFGLLSLFTQKDTAQQMGGAGIMVAEEIVDKTGGFVGALYDGYQLEQMKNILREKEKRQAQTKDWYRSSLTLLKGFKRRGAYDRMLMLQKKVPSDANRLTMIDIDLASLEKQLPVLRNTRDVAQELFDGCQKQLRDACERPDKETRCREALIKQRAAEKAFDACKEKN